MHTAQSGLGLSVTPQHKQPSPATPPRPICSTFDSFYPQGRLPVWAQIPSLRPSVPRNKWEWHLSQLQLPVAFTSRFEGKKITSLWNSVFFLRELQRKANVFVLCKLGTIECWKQKPKLVFTCLCYFTLYATFQGWSPRNMTDPSPILSDCSTATEHG